MKTALVLAVVLTGIICKCTPSGGDADGDAPALVINEFMASNGSDSIVDEYGDADDWIELFNRGDAAVEIRGCFLSDDSTNPHAYPLPDTTVPPAGFLLVWADNDALQGKWHAPFKLSAQDGEEIILTRGKAQIIDRIQFFPHNNNPLARVPDESYGRERDGSENWVQQREPTPGSANVGGRSE